MQVTHLGRVVRAMLISCLLAAPLVAQNASSSRELVPAPDRSPSDGGGPYDRLVIRGITVIDGTGAAPQGPMDIVVEKNRIVDVVSVGAAHTPIKEKGRPAPGKPGQATREIDGSGMYLLPGFVDTHVHYGDPKKAPTAEYVNKLWLASGVTTVRGVPAAGLDWSLHERERSAKNETTAPRIYVYQPSFTGDGWKDHPEQTPEQGREWVRFIASKHVDGIKFFGGDPATVAAILDEGKKYNLGSLAHLGQESEPRLNARDATRLGLRTITHSYGLFESLLKDATIQDYPADQNYADEQQRFGQVARNWNRIYPRGSQPWNDLIAEWVKGGTVLNPTFTIYSAGRDLMRAYSAEWHDKYTLPSLMQYYQPNRENHGSFFYNWTTEDEVAYKNYFRVWMEFIDDFKNAGGHVTVGTDAGFIYQTYGFTYIEELEMLREAGFTPLEVIRSATLYGAEELESPKHPGGTMGLDNPDFGIIRPGKLADMVILDQNPLANLKVLYPTGWMRLNDATGRTERVGGIRYTIKDGIVFDSKKLLADVAEMVKKQKEQLKGPVTLQGNPVTY
jgi:imidazolonepropionase-like amidohydrolase